VCEVVNAISDGFSRGLMMVVSPDRGLCGRRQVLLRDDDRNGSIRASPAGREDSGKALVLSFEEVGFGAHQIVPEGLEVQPADVLAAHMLAAVA